MIDAILTNHSAQRARERLSITIGEFKELINQDIYTPIGYDKHRIHKLFYSVGDDRCFVAIQDERNGEVVTILPISYHCNIAWKIDPKVCRTTKKMTLAKFKAWPKKSSGKPLELSLPPRDPQE